MADTSSPVTHLPGMVQDYFVVENNIASTRVVKVFKALDKFKRQSVGLIVSRTPVPVDRIPLFAARATQLSHITEISSYGLDAHGTAFVVLPVLDGNLLGDSVLEEIELERRYLSALRLVARLHEHKLTCGDLCLSSFLLGRFGSLQLFAGWCVLEQPAQTLTDESDEGEPCIAPEQREGSEPTNATDVFALGVIGYRLFTGEYPRFEDSGFVTSQVLTLNPSAPGWIDEVLTKALAPVPTERLQTAADMVQAIVQWKENTAAREALPTKTDAPVIMPSSRTSSSGAVVIELRALPGQAIDKKPVPKPSGPRVVTLMKGILLIGLLCIGLWMGFKGTSVFHREERSAALDIRPGDISEELLNAREEGDTETYIEELATSGDPLAHDILIRMFKEADSEQAASKVWDSLLTRARRNGLVRASDHVRAWIKFEAISLKRSSTLELALRLLDPALPMPVRIELLETVRTVDPKFAVVLAASLALDLKQVDSFRPIFLASAAGMLAVVPSELQERSVGALMLATPAVSSLYAEDLLTVPNVISDSDLLWLLPEMTKRQLPGVKRISDQARARRLVPDSAAIFLEILSRTSIIPARVQSTLVACALGQAGKADVVSFAGWYDSDAEKALWALVVNTKDSEVGERAFDALAAKPMLVPGISDLYELVRSTYYADRAVVGRPVAALALENVLSDADFSRAFEGLNDLPQGRELLKVVLKGPSPRALREVIRRYGPLLDRMQLLDVIKHPDPQVRAAAVEALSGANDVVILKILADTYAEEAELVVRSAYENHISTIKERVNR
jgi:hypothetical protein